MQISQLKYKDPIWRYAQAHGARCFFLVLVDVVDVEVEGISVFFGQLGAEFGLSTVGRHVDSICMQLRHVGVDEVFAQLADDPAGKVEIQVEIFSEMNARIERPEIGDDGQRGQHEVVLLAHHVVKIQIVLPQLQVVEIASLRVAQEKRIADVEFDAKIKGQIRVRCAGCFLEEERERCEWWLSW